MDAQKVLESILADYVRDYKASRVIQAIDRKIEKGIYRYSEAEMLAQESGRILESAFRKYLPEALTDGKLFRATAEVVLKNPMLQGSRDVRNAAVRIQRGLNEQAGIGINAIVPEVNEDQINGIITGICNAQSFEAEEEKLYDQVGNFLEGYVDDFVHDNAEFQYQAGMEPKVIRTAAGKCCKWCDNLAGTYLYEDVRDKGNEVWRRHNNCHCLVEYDPGQKDRKRVRISGPRSTDPGKADRISFGEEKQQAGGYSGAVKTEKQKNEHANRYYEEIRNRKPYSDAIKIAQRVEGFTVDELEDVRQHMFIREVKRDGTYKRFDPDYDQSQVWQRLTTDQPLWDSDRLLLEHERMESRIMRETGCSYEEAHDETQLKFDWWSAFQEEKERRGQ